uniref:Uncharacterized protein n=1 Tax=Trichogramma kaykai TaxID=54128 RepID=A0ABD2X7C7_9HYME
MNGNNHKGKESDTPFVLQREVGARADEILVDLGGSDPTYGQPIENLSNRSRSVRFQSPLLNDRPLDSCINASDIAQDELTDQLALIYRYATGANLRPNLNHPNDLRQCGYNSQSYDQRPSAYTSQADRGYTYARQIEEAVEQLPLFERKIVRALQSKLVGEAEDIVGKLVDYCSVDELFRDLRDRFVNRNVADGLAMKLGNAKQQADDDVRKFGCTIRSLYDNAVAAYRQAPDISPFEREAAIYSLQDNVLDCFLLGLC